MRRRRYADFRESALGAVFAHHEVKQGEQEVLYARVSVGQTPRAPQRCPIRGIRARIENSRRTGCVNAEQPELFLRDVRTLFALVAGNP